MDDSTNQIVSLFKTLVSQNVAVPVAAMNALVQKIKDSHASTWMELEGELRLVIANLKKCSREDLGGRTNISLGSGCDLFMKYVTRAFNLESMEFDTCKQELSRRGERFAGMSMASRTEIATLGHSFIRDDCTVLIHGSSRVVTAVVLKAASENKQFNLLVTEGRPAYADSEHAVSQFVAAGIPTKIVWDSAVGAIMEQVDMVMVGAEGVMENGGIVNKVGTYQIALSAQAMNKPFYVAVESYKFARMYPLSQRDTHDMCKQASTVVNMHQGSASGSMRRPSNTSALNSPLISSVKVTSPTISCVEEKLSEQVNGDILDLPPIDFTPAKLITLLFTDLGVLTPAAVSDELIRLYQ